MRRFLHNRLRTLSLGLLLLVAFSVAAGQQQQPDPGPAGVATVVDVSDRFVLFEGLQVVNGRSFPDGRVWLLDRESDKVRALTTAQTFDKHFFATGALLLDEGSALVKVNRNGDAGNLYRVDLESGEASFMTDIERLGLVDILDHSFALSPDGATLAFTAFEEVLLPAATGPSFVWLMGVYTLKLGGDRLEAGLKLIEQVNLAGPPTLLYPVYLSNGELAVVREETPVYPELAKADSARSEVMATLVGSR